VLFSWLILELLSKFSPLAVFVIKFQSANWISNDTPLFDSSLNLRSAQLKISQVLCCPNVSFYWIPDLKSLFAVSNLMSRGKRGKKHKVLTYIEYRAVYGIFRTIDPPQSECVLPPHLRRGSTLAGRWDGGGGQYQKTPDIGLASYSIIPLPEERSDTVNVY
jgi:hypothetical protein